MSETQTDEELALRVQKGDESAFGELMDRYTAKLIRYGKKLLPHENNIGDMVQDVFITVYRNIADFDATRKFSPWIYRIAHNAFVDALRKKTREPVLFFDFSRFVPHSAKEDTLVEQKEKEEMGVLLNKRIEGLPSVYREIIELYYFENFSYKEIADILHVPLGTVGIRLSRAREALKKKFPKDYYE